MSDQTAAPPAPPEQPPEQQEKRSRFTLPSAYTILFALIVLAAIATWIVPAGRYDLNKQGEPIPGTYHEVESHPQRILVDSLKAPINGMYGIENKKGNISPYNNGSLFGAITELKPASSGARIGLGPAWRSGRPGSPGIVHAFSIAGGATSPPWIDLAAKSGSV